MAASIEYKLDPSLAEADPELYDLLEHERARQFKGLGAFTPQILWFPKNQFLKTPDSSNSRLASFKIKVISYHLNVQIIFDHILRTTGFNIRVEDAFL
jgi:hypothetical protein